MGKFYPMTFTKPTLNLRGDQDPIDFRQLISSTTQVTVVRHCITAEIGTSSYSLYLHFSYGYRDIGTTHTT